MQRLCILKTSSSDIPGDALVIDIIYFAVADQVMDAYIKYARSKSWGNKFTEINLMLKK